MICILDNTAGLKCNEGGGICGGGGGGGNRRSLDSVHHGPVGERKDGMLGLGSGSRRECQ